MATKNASAKVKPSPRSGKHYFTLDEANRALPYVARVIDDIIGVYAQVVDLRKRIESPVPADAGRDLEPEYERQMDRLSDLVDELQQVGVELKDFEKGLIDFPSLHQDREVCLCWHHGETTIAHWHEVEAGFAGRQPVSTLAD